MKHQEFKYTPEHAAKALEIMRRLLPQVKARPEYLELISILENPDRWREAHGHFTKIRTHITLPAERRKLGKLEQLFIGVAETAAKTAYNCSGADDNSNPAPFDDDSFDGLLECEQRFLEERSGKPGAAP